MTRMQLVDLCGARCGDKGDISDISLFADDLAAYAAIKHAVTAEVVEATSAHWSKDRWSGMRRRTCWPSSS